MIVLLSGGIDSIAAWRLVGLPAAVNFDINTVCITREQQAIAWAEQRFGRRCIKRRLPMDGEKPNGWVPFRNSLLVLAAAQIDTEVILAAVAEWAPDKNMRWARSLEAAVNRGGVAATADEELHIRMPFAAWSKCKLLYKYHQAFGAEETAELLANTWSCYKSLAQPCGVCGGCRQRIAAHHQYAKLAGLPPPKETAERWRIPPLDAFRWVRDNGPLGIRQIIAHRKQDESLPYV